MTEQNVTPATDAEIVSYRDEATSNGDEWKWTDWHIRQLLGRIDADAKVIAELRAVAGPPMPCGHFAVHLISVRSPIRPNYLRCRKCNAEYDATAEIIEWWRSAREG